MLLVAAIALALAVIQWVHPFSARLSPMVLIVVALLLGARYAVRRQARKRSEILRAVPRRPLGLDDDAKDS